MTKKQEVCGNVIKEADTNKMKCKLKVIQSVKIFDEETSKRTILGFKEQLFCYEKNCASKMVDFNGFNTDNFHLLLNLALNAMVKVRVYVILLIYSNHLVI